jgi:hypothetical protein
MVHRGRKFKRTKRIKWWSDCKAQVTRIIYVGKKKDKRVMKEAQMTGPQRKAKSCQNNRHDREQGKRNDNSE